MSVKTAVKQDDIDNYKNWMQEDPISGADKMYDDVLQRVAIFIIGN